MKTSLHYFSLFVFSLCLSIVACKKEDSSTTTPNQNTGSTSNLTAKIDGNSFKEQMNLTISKNSSGSTVTQRDTSITFTVNSAIKPGVYALPSNDFSLSLSQKVSGQSKYFVPANTGDSFNTVNITRYDTIAKVISGSFQAHMAAQDDFSSSPVTVHVIKEGTFTITYK